MTDTFRPAHLGDVVLGEGAPKIIVPVVDSTHEGVLATIAALPESAVDVVELRLDHFAAWADTEAVLELVGEAREALGPVPALATFRSKPEGGQADIEPEAYEQLLLAVARSGFVEAIDVEMFTELASLERLVNGAHAAGAAVVMSSHDFLHTPTLDQIIARLTLQQDLGADVVKIAVMPSSPSDVLTLLQATDEFRRLGHRPAITMAMGPLGVVSRLAGETFGSAATFGSVGTASAPGQVDAVALRAVLDVVHAAQPTPPSSPAQPEA